MHSENEGDLLLQSTSRFFDYLDEIRDTYIQSAKDGLLLDEEMQIMDGVVQSWKTLYSHLGTLYVIWEKRSSSYKKNRQEIIEKIKYESSFFFLKMKEVKKP